MILEQFHGWDFVMLAALAVVSVFEILNLFNPAVLTITHLVREYLPVWVQWLAWLWLGWHFLLK